MNYLEFMLYLKNLSSLMTLTAICSPQKSTSPHPRLLNHHFLPRLFSWVLDESINCLLESSVCICILNQVGFASNSATSLKSIFPPIHGSEHNAGLLVSISLLTSYSAEVLWALCSKVLSNLSFSSSPMTTTLIRMLIIFSLNCLNSSWWIS